MIARIFTRLFYALVFFGLGVWAAPSMSEVGRTLDRGVTMVSDGAQWLWSLAEETITTRPETASPPAAPAVAQPAPAKPAPTAAKPAPVPAPAPTAAKPAAAPTEIKPAITADTVAEARSAYGRGDVAGAVRAYEAAVAIAPRDAAISGELGNVLWANGRLAEAAKAYHRAGAALVAADRAREAAPLVEAIRRGDPRLADDLAQLIAKAR